MEGVVQGTDTLLKEGCNKTNTKVKIKKLKLFIDKISDKIVKYKHKNNTETTLTD